LFFANDVTKYVCMISLSFRPFQND